MPAVTTQDGTEIFYKDWGKGEPIFFHHGWPLSADDWDAQMMFFPEQGLSSHSPRSPWPWPVNTNGHWARHGHLC
jgi:pimeloyl-ACP methyl ester carboxylesterase